MSLCSSPRVVNFALAVGVTPADPSTDDLLYSHCRFSLRACRQCEEPDPESKQFSIRNAVFLLVGIASLRSQ